MAEPKRLSRMCDLKIYKIAKPPKPIIKLQKQKRPILDFTYDPMILQFDSKILHDGIQKKRDTCSRCGMFNCIERLDFYYNQFIKKTICFGESKKTNNKLINYFVYISKFKECHEDNKSLCILADIYRYQIKQFMKKSSK